LSAAVYFTQGIEGLPGLSFFFFLKEKLHFTPEKIMYIGSITGLAWLVKPLWGYLCDNYLTKKKWIILSLIGSILISLYFGLSPLLTVGTIIIMASLGGWTSAVRDVAVDGVMCVTGKEHDECGRIQALQWASITVASIIVGLAGGYIADHFSYKVGYLALIPIYAIIIAIVLQYKTTVLLKRTSAPILETIYSYKELFTNKTFLFACLFIFLYNFNPSFGTPLMFIERDTFKWSGTFMGILGAITSSISIIGAILYYKFGKNINVEKCLFWSVFLGALTTLCYLYFTPVSAIIYGIVFSGIGMVIFLNIMAFMAKSTIPGKEATSFALLCSINNLAGTCSTLAGAYLYPLIGLKYLIIISAFTSFLCLPLIKKIGIGNVKN
jgi:predicted MFS family arabinose efflux permease